MSAKRASAFITTRLAVVCVLGLVSVLGGCSRSGIWDLEQLPPAGDTASTVADAGSVTTVTPVVDAGPDALDATPTQKPVKAPPSIPPGKTCTPHDETCNGVDDNCNGNVDEDLPPIPCAGGGERYCIAGRYSACPTRCDACIPGSERVCFLSYCTYWAVETCASDGRSFGVCREGHVPAECADVSSAHKDSPELEQCCIDKGYCCHDEYDLDHDGNTDEMLGSCSEVSCN